MTEDTPIKRYEDKVSLDEGQATLSYPSEMSSDSVEDFEYWAAGILKRARRRVEKQRTNDVKPLIS